MVHRTMTNDFRGKIIDYDNKKSIIFGPCYNKHRGLCIMKDLFRENVRIGEKALEAFGRRK